MMNYHNGHRLFLQTFVSRKFMTEQESKKLYAKVGIVCQEDACSDNFGDFLRVINKQMEPLFMEIRRGRTEDTGEWFYALVNTIEDEHSKLATDFQNFEIDYVKKVIDLIVLSEEGLVSTIDLMNCGLDLRKRISSQAAEEILAKMFSQGWLIEKHGNVSLGVRSVIELGQYLKNKYEEEIHECPLCHDFIVMGDSCLECGVKLHKYCAHMTFARVPDDKRKCPSCKKLWLNEVPRLRQSTSTSGENLTSSGITSATRVNVNVPVVSGTRKSSGRSKR